MLTVKVAHGEKIVEASTRKKNQVQSGLKGCCLFCWRSFYLNKNFDTCYIAKSDFPFCCSKIDIWNIQTVVFKTLFALFLIFWSLGWSECTVAARGRQCIHQIRNIQCLLSSTPSFFLRESIFWRLNSEYQIWRSIAYQNHGEFSKIFMCVVQPQKKQPWKMQFWNGIIAKRKYHEIKNPQSKLVCHVVVSLQHLHDIVLLNRIHLTHLTYQIQKKTLVFVQPCPSFLFFFYVVSSNFQMSAWETGARQRLGKEQNGLGSLSSDMLIWSDLFQPPVKKVTSRQCINLSKIARIWTSYLFPSHSCCEKNTYRNRVWQERKIFLWEIWVWMGSSTENISTKNTDPQEKSKIMVQHSQSSTE